MCRNRNIGTAKSGHGQNNRLVIPWGRADMRPFWACIGPHITVTRPVHGKPFSVLVEPTRFGSVHACTVDDVFRMLEQVPAVDREGMSLVVLRQPSCKEEVLSSVWGRLAYLLCIGPHESPAVILEAVDPLRPRCWSKSLPPDWATELDRLRQDGHRITTTRHGHLVQSDLAAVRATQLYRTLPHEIGHWRD